MASIINAYSRLEPFPGERNFETGFAAEIADPVWFIGRQWQMGEHQGENASSPVWVSYDVNSRLIIHPDERFDPSIVPAEAIVESELFDWWTMGRRIRIGRLLAEHAAVAGKEELLFFKPTPPYEHFHDEVDGLAVWLKRGELGIADNDFGDSIPQDSIPSWNSEELLYQQTNDNAFESDQLKLTVNRHRGGRLDWYSVDGSAGDAATDNNTEQQEGIPTALQYSGAPNSRWWEFENSDVDMGGYVPDSSHTPTAFLSDLIFSHSDDWFLFPVLAQTGNIVSIKKINVLDVFGREYKSEEVDAAENPAWKGLQPPDNWTLFQVDGLKASDLILWHVAEMPLESIPVERVQFGMDEESNLLWAVERVIDGREVESRKADPPDPSNKKFNAGTPIGNADEREYAYVPAQGIVPYWHPYEIDEVDGERKLVRRILPDLSLQKPVAMPAPQAEVLQADNAGEFHQVNPLAVPSNGIEVSRRWQLARDMNGFPVLWLQRQRDPLLSPPARRLRFDVMEEASF